MKIVPTVTSLETSLLNSLNGAMPFNTFSGTGEGEENQGIIGSSLSAQRRSGQFLAPISEGNNYVAQSLKYTFRQLLEKYLQTPGSKPLTLPSGLTTSHLALDLNVKQADFIPQEGQKLPEVHVTVFESGEGAAARMEVYEQNGRGGYTVTVIQMALRSTTVGQVTESTVGSTPGSLNAFLAQEVQAVGQVGAWTETYSQQVGNASDVLVAEQRYQRYLEQQSLEAQMEAAWVEMAAKIGQKYGAGGLGLTDEEKKIVEQALDRDPSEVSKAMLLELLKKRYNKLKELEEEAKAADSLRAEINQTHAELNKYIDKLENNSMTEDDKARLKTLLNNLSQLEERLAEHMTALEQQSMLPEPDEELKKATRPDLVLQSFSSNQLTSQRLEEMFNS